MNFIKVRRKLRVRVSRKRALLAGAALAAVTLLTVSGCTQGGAVPTGQQQEQNTSRAIQTQFEQGQPAPEFNFSQYRQNLIDAEASQALGINTTTFFFPTGGTFTQPVFTCPSKGGAVPNTAQLTNPNQIIPDPNSTNGSVTIGNMDPNGTYAPAASEGTYVMCVNAQGQEYQTYWEGPVFQVNGLAKWTSGGIQVEGAPVMPSCTKVGGKEVCTAPTK